VSVTETVLVFVGIPVGLYLLAMLVIYGPSAARQPRYRPGRPWTHEPVWFLPAIDSATIAGVSGHGHSPAAGSIESPASVLDAPTRTAVGGATGEW
jgi:hypothetical protein